MNTMCEREENSYTKIMGHPCINLTETDSTNLQARQMSDKGAAHGTLICAERQTAGRGRRGRSWDSPPGDSVYMSLLLRPEILPERVSMLTLVMGLAVCEACNEMLTERFGESAPRVQLKWPNDLVLNGKKIAGILTELRMDAGSIQDVIIGVGINVNARQFPKELPSAGSLLQEAQLAMEEAGGQPETKPLDRQVLIGLCMKWFEVYYEKFVQAGDLRTLKEAYEKSLVNMGRQVLVLDPAGEYKGVACGIRTSGELLVEREDGTITAVYAGEVSVRGVYGYV